MNVLGRSRSSGDTEGGGALEISTRIEEMDIDRLSKEKDSYQVWLDNRIEEAYTIASGAKSKGLDFSETIEIPRAADLASRTEKLLEDPYLYPDPERKETPALRIEVPLRELLLTHDRETAAIMIAISVTK